MIAHFGGPHWFMTDADAKQYAVAWQNALRHFNVTTSQKAVDMMALFMAVTWHEGMRIGETLRQTRQAQQQHRPAPQQQANPAASFVFDNQPELHVDANIDPSALN